MESVGITWTVKMKIHCAGEAAKILNPICIIIVLLLQPRSIKLQKSLFATPQLAGIGPGDRVLERRSLSQSRSVRFDFLNPKDSFLTCAIETFHHIARLALLLS
jgi:hypothetical protein